MHCHEFYKHSTPDAPLKLCVLLSSFLIVINTACASFWDPGPSSINAKKLEKVQKFALCEYVHRKGQLIITHFLNSNPYSFLSTCIEAKLMLIYKYIHSPMQPQSFTLFAVAAFKMWKSLPSDFKRQKILIFILIKML